MDEVQTEKVALDSRRDKNPVRVPLNNVLLDNVSCIREGGQTDAKVGPLRRQSVATRPVSEDTCTERTGQADASAGSGRVAIANGDVILDQVVRRQ